MKKINHYLIAVSLIASLSSCSISKPTDMQTTVMTTTTFSETPAVTETTAQNDVPSDSINNSFVFYDYTGEPVTVENVSGYILNYVLGWQAFGNGTLHKIDNTTIINNMAVTDVYSEYSIFQTRDGYEINYSGGRYSLVSAKDVFEGIKTKAILLNNGNDWVLKIIKEESDEYFFDTSSCDTFKLEEYKTNSVMNVGEQAFNVQPMNIVIGNADEFNEIKNLDKSSIYLAELTLGSIGFQSRAQDVSDSTATLFRATAYLKSVGTLVNLK